MKNYRPGQVWVAGEILKKRGYVLFEVKVLNGKMNFSLGVPKGMKQILGAMSDFAKEKSILN